MDRLALGCFVLAFGLVVNAVLGPLVLGVIDYRYTVTFENQGIGLDAFAVVIAAPVLCWAGALARGGRRVAPFLALGPALMAMYLMPQYVLGADYRTLPGNNEDYVLLHLALFVVAGAVALQAWSLAEHEETEAHRPDRVAGWLMLAIAAFLVLRYLPGLIAISGGAPSPEYLDDPTAFWLIAFMDLGIVLPVAAGCGVALLRGVARMRTAMYAVAGWFALVGPAVAAMGLAMILRDDPHASVAGTAVFAVFGVAFAALAAYLFRPLFRR